MSLFTEQILIEHPGEDTGEADAAGRPIVGDPVQITVEGWYEPRSSSEDVVAKEQQTDGYWVYVLRGTDMTAQSRVFIEGDWYEVDGEPGRTPDGFLLGGYLSVAVRRVQG